MNQSMVQQLTMEGNMRSRVRNASPKGDMHNTMWMLARTRLMYCSWRTAERAAACGFFWREVHERCPKKYEKATNQTF